MYDVMCKALVDMFANLLWAQKFEYVHFDIFDNDLFPSGQKKCQKHILEG